MMSGVLFSAIAALGDVAGGLLVVLVQRRNKRLMGALIGFSAGFMVAVALAGMLPHAIEAEAGLIAAVVGYLGVHLTQHTLTPHFHFGEETHEEAMVSRGVGVFALVGLVPHSFFDGVAIAAGFLDSTELGLLVFAAILLHKVPTGLSLASVMMASGNARGPTLLAVAGLGAATVVGALVTPAIALLEQYGLALAAGVTIYVAASNLIPEAQHERSWGVQIGVFAGAVAFFVLRAVLPAS